MLLLLFRETRIGYRVSLISGVIFLIFGGLTLFLLFASSERLVIILIPVLWLALSALYIFGIRAIFEKIASRRIAMINSLWENHDFENFAAVYGKLSGNVKEKGAKGAEIDILLPLSTAYLHCGNNTAAAQTLSKMNDFPKTREGTGVEFIYHNNWFVYYLRAEKLCLAEQTLAHMEAMLQNGEWDEADLALCSVLCTEKRSMLNMANGDYSDCEDVFDAKYEKATDAWDKVIAKYTLGKLYLHQNREAEAVEAFTYVAIHGGFSVYRQTAIEELEMLGKPVSIPAEEKPAVKLFSRKQTFALVFSLVALVLLAFGSLILFISSVLALARDLVGTLQA